MVYPSSSQVYTSSQVLFTHVSQAALSLVDHGAHIAAVCTHRSCGNYTFDHGVEHPRVLRVGKKLLSPQNKPLPSQETDGKRRRNPLQKAPPHKECQKRLTPSEVTRDSPQGPEPLFHTRPDLPNPPCFTGVSDKTRQKR